MKRLAWLLLALSLPAWATINGVDSSRVVLPSFDGTRYGAYVAGDYPTGGDGVFYANAFDGNPTTTKDADYGNIGILANQGDIEYDPDSIDWDGLNCGSGLVYSGPDLFIVDESGNKVLRYAIDASASGYNLECSNTLRHRALLIYGNNLSNDKTGAAHTTGGSGFRIIPDTEYWFGWRYKMDCAGSLPQNFFMFAPASSNPAEPVIQVKGDCEKLVIIPERYRDENDDTFETVKNTTGAFTENQWHCVVVHWIKKPYSWGNANSYDPGTTGGTRAGTFEVWVDGALQPGAHNATNGYGYTGTDHEGAGRLNSRFRVGYYWGTTTNSTQASLYVDDLKMADGANRSASVNPEGCAEITP